ncbi:hypothetical protein LQ757_18920 [Agromyces sp. SYSU K20354]|uniref:hypothetical protein n=1 Tax=Agromyces cavernae TaxID=2898659 RepID=UPI001E5D2936|nr:hypothetical protein [Agromyces cavernae]MCD2444358.1 hypothetical protein [Agromyces cavernae]
MACEEFSAVTSSMTDAEPARAEASRPASWGIALAIAAIVLSAPPLLFFLLVVAAGGFAFILLVSPFIIGVWVLSALALLFAILAVRARAGAVTITALVLAGVAVLASVGFGIATNFGVVI